MRAPTHFTPLAPTGAAAEAAGPPTASTLDMVSGGHLRKKSRASVDAVYIRRLSSPLDPGTNSELSNPSESEDVSEREQRPRGIGGDERGARRGGRGRGANSGRGRGGPAVAKPANSISSGK